MKNKNLVLGILAHVDAGKTTLSESLLYESGKIRKPGRVDHKDAFLDTYALERERGITIFSKQAVLPLGERLVTLLDTPGHVDFSAEMERTLQVLDVAILVISGADGVQGHTRTLWKLLRRYQIPTFLFINKMDQEGTDKKALHAELVRVFSENCICFGAESESQEEFWENVAMTEESLLEKYLAGEKISDEEIALQITRRQVFPCYFGSALKLTGVAELMDGLRRFAVSPEYSDTFAAKVFKISRDDQGMRLTHLKVTGGTMKVKEMITLSGMDDVQEKINQIRRYSGEKFELMQEAEAGEICAVTGLTSTWPGQCIGAEQEENRPVLEPVLSYRILPPEGCDLHQLLKNLKQLEEEDPMLRIVWMEEVGEIHAQLMGEIQIQILERLIEERFHTRVSFDAGSIVYKETIAGPVEGVGHYEPLRHYAEAHILIEPLEAGSGIVIDTVTSEERLDRNWQRLIMTHLAEKTHCGVLGGFPLCDVKFTLVAGKAHLKHTEGGDFREATYRAVRQGLMQADNILLEPFYDFRLEIPSDMVGRAMNDIQQMAGKFEPPTTSQEEMATLEGFAPVATMRDYQKQVSAYSKGRGHLVLTFGGYAPCHNTEEVLAKRGYQADADTENPSGSIFCSHGAGFFVPWDQVPEHMHLESTLMTREKKKQQQVQERAMGNGGRLTFDSKEEKELEEIFIRTYGKIESKGAKPRQLIGQKKEAAFGGKKKTEEKEYLLVDGYNVIHAWDDLKELAQENFEAARGKLMDILCNYQGFKKCELILVFDAYKVEGFAMEIQKYKNIYVVYTKEAETADMYIEKVVHEIGRKYHVTVATSDGLEQVVTLGQGGKLISAREFREEVEIVNQQIRETWEQQKESDRNYLFHHMDQNLAEDMEQIRLGKKRIEEV